MKRWTKMWEADKNVDILNINDWIVGPVSVTPPSTSTSCRAATAALHTTKTIEHSDCVIAYMQDQHENQTKIFSGRY